MGSFGSRSFLISSQSENALSPAFSGARSGILSDFNIARAVLIFIIVFPIPAGGGDRSGHKRGASNDDRTIP